MAMGLPPVTSASKLSIFVRHGRLGGISYEVLLPLRDKAWLVCMNVCMLYEATKGLTVLKSEKDISNHDLLSNCHVCTIPHSCDFSEMWVYGQSTVHQTKHFELCTVLISRALALISNCKCISGTYCWPYLRRELVCSFTQNPHKRRRPLIE
jgi:hypothetical protein